MRRLPLVPLTAALVLVAGPALAGKAESGEPGGSTPTPSEGKEIEISFNPRIVVTVQPSEDILTLFLRLASELQAAAKDRYSVDADLSGPPFGLRILRSDGREIDQLGFRENDPGLQINAISVDRAGLIAKIHRVEEDPAGGQLLITLNDRVIPVDTSASGSRDLVSTQMLTAIRNAGFDAELGAAFLVVSRDLQNDRGLTRVGIKSTDPALVTSEIVLEASPAGGNIPVLTPTGLAALAGLLALGGVYTLRHRRALGRSGPHRSSGRPSR